MFPLPTPPVSDLIYATDTSGAWVNITVDAPGQVGLHNSIAVDSEDVVHIAYYSLRDDTNAVTQDLKYAYVRIIMRISIFMVKHHH